MTQYAPNPQQQTEQKPSNGLGLTGFVIGLVGLVLSFIPLVGVVAWPLVILGIIFSAIGISKAVKRRATHKGLAITGLVVSIVGLVMCVLWASVIKTANDEVNEAANRETVVVYEITGDAANVDVTYSVLNGDNMDSEDETVATLPWKKEVKMKGFAADLLPQVLVTTGEAGGNVTCKLTVDGKEVDTETASGPFELATCDNI